MQNQIKETRNTIEVIDLGNKLVFKEYQKMGTENTVSLPNYNDLIQFFKGDNISKNFTNGSLKQEVNDD